MASLKYEDNNLKVKVDGDAPDVLKAVKIGYWFRIGIIILTAICAGLLYVVTHQK